jgi:hypothetical protein
MSEALTIFVEQVEEVAASGDRRRRTAILDLQLAQEIYRKRPTARPSRLDLRA